MEGDFTPYFKSGVFVIFKENIVNVFIETVVYSRLKDILAVHLLYIANIRSVELYVL